MEEKHTNTKKKRRWLRLWIKIISCVVVIVALLPAALYIPAVQNNVKTLVAEKVSEATGYDVEIGRFLLKFPVDVSVERFSVTAQQLDTLVSGSVARVDVRLIPLLMGDIVVRGIELENARYKMVSPDSSMLFSAKVRRWAARAMEEERIVKEVRWETVPRERLPGQEESECMTFKGVRWGQARCRCRSMMCRMRVVWW